MSLIRSSKSRFAKRAKIIPIPNQRHFIEHVETLRYGSRNRVLALLSYKAGLRACEIARIDWSMVCDAGGEVGNSIEISKSIAKKGSGRRVPCHRELRIALKLLHIEQGKPARGSIVRSERGGSMTARGVVNWFGEHYRRLGYDGCTSHSGRRTMITMAARSLAKVGGSLRDVQELAGHRSLATTEGYIQGDRDIQRKLLELL